MQNNPYINQRIIDIANKIINDEIDPVEGGVFIQQNRFMLDSIDGEDDVFTFFVGFSSETEGVPFESKRKYYSKEYLLKSDERKKKYLLVVSDELKKACSDLIKKLQS
jgi:hypothetical protein